MSRPAQRLVLPEEAGFMGFPTDPSNSMRLSRPFPPFLPGESESRMRAMGLMKMEPSAQEIRNFQVKELRSLKKFQDEHTIRLGDDIPVHETDFEYPPPTAETPRLEAACSSGNLVDLQTILSDVRRARFITPRFLHGGFTKALNAGHTEIVRTLLENGAVVGNRVPREVLKAPEENRLALFKILAEHGWSPRVPSSSGETLLPHVVRDHSIVEWFLENGADPNAFLALELAARDGSVETVRALLDAGANISNGVPLHLACGSCPDGVSYHNDPFYQSTPEDDLRRIPIMELLVTRGADVNGIDNSPYVVPRRPLSRAVRAGAVERVKWLLRHGADHSALDLDGPAALYARKFGSKEMKEVLGADK